MKRSVLNKTKIHGRRSGSASACVVLFMLALIGSPQAMSQDTERGKALFQKLKCVECHSVAGTGGCLAPALDGVTDRRDKAYIRLRLNKDDEDSFIKLIGHPELMPHPRFSKTQVADLSAYLSTFRSTKQTDSVHHAVKNLASGQPAKAITKSAESVAEGKELLYKNACLACHSVGGLGGSTGPSLDGVALRRSRESIDEFIASPMTKGKTEMPKCNLTAAERQKITEFLLTLPPAKRPHQHG